MVKRRRKKFHVTLDECWFSLPSGLSKPKSEINKITLISIKRSFLYLARACHLPQAWEKTHACRGKLNFSNEIVFYNYWKAKNFLQILSSRGALHKRFSEKSPKIHTKTLVQEYLF